MSAYSRTDSCPVTVRLAGYRKNEAVLRNGALIVMRRLGSYANPTVSLTMLGAPEETRNAFRKGIAAMSGKKWAVAQKEFDHAVTTYPEYAPAWNALGEVLIEQSKPQMARKAFERAVKIDPRCAAAWVHLARLAAEEGRMEDALQAAERALQLDATGFPEVYVSLATAELALDRLDAAEKSARRAVKLDILHEIPSAERVLGSVLAEKGDTRGALEHWKKYLEMSPKAQDIAEVTEDIADLEANAPAPVR
jgi:tetratricopeptide (TPR) repeat protein